MNEVKRVMHHKAYRDPVFHNHRQKMIEFLKAVTQMQISNELFKIMRILIKFFRFSILILFKPIYRKIQLQKQKYLSQSHDDLLKVAGFVKAIIKNKSFPSLQFYFKAGYSSDIPQLPGDEYNGDLIMRFIQKIDEQMNEESQTQLVLQQKKLQRIEERIQGELKKCTVVIQQLCLEEYLRVVRERRQDIAKEIRLQGVVVHPFVKVRSTKIKIQGPQQRQIDDPQAASDYLCCRPYFYQGEIIDQPQTLVQEYKNYEYPFDRSLGDILLKTICGFLNNKGGIIYIGIRQKNQTKKRTVAGQKYTQNAKEDLLKYFRLLCQNKIFPEIVDCQFYKLEYVPLKDAFRKGEWIPGKFVVRLRVDKGDRRELYSFKKHDGEELFAFRTENQVLTHRIGQNIIEIYRKRLTTSDDGQDFLNHPGPCRPVQMGKQLCQYDRPNIQLPWNEKERSVNYGKGKAANKDSGSMRPIFVCFDKDLLVSLTKYNFQKSKSGYQYLEPMNLTEAKTIEEIIVRSDRAKDYEKISLLLRFNGVSMARIHELLNKILYTQVYADEIVFNSVDQAICAINILDRASVSYKFIFNNV